MAKGRMLNKKISYDEGVAKLSLEATLLYTWIIPHLDVKGRTYGDPNIIKGIVPYIDELTISKIEKCLVEMVDAGLILLYGNRRKYLEFIGFTKNQNLHESREAESVIPTPELLMSNSCVTPAKDKIREDKIREDKISKDKGFSFDEIYLKYPNRVGKKDACRHFGATVKTEQDFLDIQTALKNYLVSDRVKKGFVQNASTWFNDWKSWVNVKSKDIEYYPADSFCMVCNGTGKVINGEGAVIRCSCVKEKK